MTSVPRLFAIAALALATLGMAKKPALTVRFHVEANKLDGSSFASPVNLKFPPRPAFVERVATISERHIVAVYPAIADDGSWGCTFKLNNSGRINLEVVSTEQRGRALVPFIASKSGTHQLTELVIDQRITDGIIWIPRGLTALEIAALQKQFAPKGAGKKRK